MTFFALAKTNELEEGFKRSVKLPSIKLLIFVHNNAVFIVEDRCPHMDVPLITGTVTDNILRCRAHGIGFDLRTGRADGVWANTLDCLKRFEPVYRDYSVGVEWVERGVPTNE